MTDSKLGHSALDDARGWLIRMVLVVRVSQSKVNVYQSSNDPQMDLSHYMSIPHASTKNYFR